MAFPANTTVIDDFNRAGPGLGANWTADPFNDGDPAPVIASSTLLAGNDVNESMAWLNTGVRGPNCEFAWDVVTVPADGNAFGLGLRGLGLGGDADTGYVCVVTKQSGADVWELYRRDGGSWTPITGAGDPQEVVNGDKVGVRMVGNALYSFHYASTSSPPAWNQSPISSEIDATYPAAGSLYVLLYTTAVRMDNLVGGTIVAPVATLPPSGFCTSSHEARQIDTISVAEGTAPLTSVRLWCTSGDLTVTLSGSVTISAGANGTSDLTLGNGASEAEYNTVLATLSYQGDTDVHGKDTIHVESEDSVSPGDDQTFYVLNDPYAVVITDGTYAQKQAAVNSAKFRLKTGETTETFTMVTTDAQPVADTDVITVEVQELPPGGSPRRGQGILTGVLQGVL